MHKKGGRHKDHVSQDDELKDMLAFGYACRIYTSDDATDDRHLIPWNGDENIKIDRMHFNVVVDSMKTSTKARYDCRLYLSNLEQFNHRDGASDDSGDLSSAEKLEEEMCDEERYADMYTDIRKVEEEEQLKRNKKAEIGFNYDADCKAEAAVESSSSEEEIEEPYVVPDGLKLPVGMDLPDTMKQSAIIEKTAMFVVNKGPQMEIVIKAKQRKNAVQFGFLEFDNKLNAFYKYICKLIRENKYTPVPVQPKMRPKAKKLRRLALEAAKKKEDEEANRRKSSALGMIALNHGSGSEAEENDEEDEDAGYLHPLLRSSTDVPPTDEGEPAFGPVQRPKQRSETPKQDFNELLMRLQSQVDNADNVYSSLYKNLNSIIPGSKPPQDDDGAANGFADETAQIDESRTEIIYETDEGKVAEYNEWYTSFYGRPSPYPPTELPVPLPPPPNLSSALSIAARYVAMNGGAAEQRLIDHNGDGCSFLLPSSPYYTYYQSRVRQNLWSLSQAYLASLSTNNNKSTEGDPSSSSIIFPAPPRPPSALSADALRLIPTEISTNEQKKLESVGEADFSEDDGLKQERKERARLFMEKILNEKLSAKKRSQENPTIAGNDVPSEKRAKTAVQSAVATASPIEVSRLTANSISELINEKIKNVFTASPLLAVAAESDSNKKSKKKSERVEASSRDSRHQRSRRSRSKRRSSSRSRRWSRTRSPRGRRSRSRSPSHNDSRHHRSHDKSHKSRTRSRRRSRSRSLRR